MDKRLLDHIERMLRLLREKGPEFAGTYPHIAGRLPPPPYEDPYIKMIAEAFAALMGRAHLKLDAELLNFVQQFLEMVFPGYFAPVPSMAIVRMEPKVDEESLKNGFVIPRGARLLAQIARGEKTACEFRSAQEVTLWPIEVAEAEYLSSKATLSTIGAQPRGGVKAALRLRLRTAPGLTFDQLPLDRLPIYLHGGELGVGLYEQLLGNTTEIVAQPSTKPSPWSAVLPGSTIARFGFEDKDALLPCNARSFTGYRLLREYFAMPERLLFIELTELGAIVKRCVGSELDFIFFFKRNHPRLNEAVSATHFGLFCTPVVNLFPKRTDQIHISSRTPEYHIVPDRTRPTDFEVYSVTEVLGFDHGADPIREFTPIYQTTDPLLNHEREAYYTISREERRSTQNRKRWQFPGAPPSYVGSEVFIMLADGAQPPCSPDLKRLGLKVLCTNRSLPLRMPVGLGRSDFALDSDAPVKSIRCLVGPTTPKPSAALGKSAWRLISHLALNDTSLLEDDDGGEPRALRELLWLYAQPHDPVMGRQIEGLSSISSRPIKERMKSPGPIVYARGLELTILCDEQAYEGYGVYLFGEVLNRFLSLYVSMGSFIRTVITTNERGEIMRWPVRFEA